MSSVKKEVFGVLADGAEVDLVTLENSVGNKISICLYGLNVTDLLIKDKSLRPINVVLGCKTLANFVSQQISMNSIVGRVAGGIGNGRLPVGDDVYQLECNDGAHHLHGAHEFSKCLWAIERLDVVDGIPVLIASSEFSDNQYGYPGDLSCQITISFLDNNSVRFVIEGRTNKATHMNVTHHAYFNLSGHSKESILSHEFKILSEEITELDREMLPTGRLVSVEDTVMDFRSYKNLKGLLELEDFFIREYGGFDHNFVIKHEKNKDLTLCAQVYNSETGIRLSVNSTMPGIQFFTGQVLDGVPNREGGVYRNHQGFCLEPQYFPDSPNRPEFPSTIVTPDMPYQEIIEWAFDVDS